jgi:hypothetical protein
MFLDKDQDQDNWHAECLQCSYQRDLGVIAMSGYYSSSKRKEAVPVDEAKKSHLSA